MALIITALGAAVTFSLTPTYTATAFVVIRQNATDPLASPDAQTPRLDDAVTDTAVVILKSRDLARTAVQKIGYAAAPPPLPWWRAELCRRFPSQTVVEGLCEQGAASLDGRVDDFVGHLTVEPVGRSRAVSLSFTATDGEVASNALNALVAAEQAVEQQMQRGQVEQTAQWLEGRSSELRDRWMQAEQRVSEFRVKNGLTQTSAGGGAQPLILQQLASATTALSQAQSDLTASTARAAGVQQALRSDKRSLVRMAEQPVIAASAVALNELYVQRAKITQQFGPNYPSVLVMSRQIVQAEAGLNAQLDSSLQTVRSDVGEKQAQVDGLTRTLNDLRQRYNDLNARQTQVQALEGEAKGAQLSYETFLSQSQRFAGRSEIQQPTMTAAARAHAPVVPSFPRKSRFLPAAAILGLITGVALAFTREHLWHGFAEINRVGSAVSLPLIATVPFIKPRGWGKRRQQVARYAAERPMSEAAEAARSLFASIALRKGGENAPQSVAITSATSQESKSVLSLWLASVVARTGQHVLVIDCDQRAGTVAANLQGRERPGLGALLQGKATINEIVQRDPKTGIHFIAADRSVDIAGSTLDTERLRAILEELKRVYRLIILDTPPLLATSSALLYCSITDQTVYVCRWRSTRREAVHASLERLRGAHARLTGIVLSMVPSKDQLLYNDTLLRRDQSMFKRYYSNDRA